MQCPYCGASVVVKGIGRKPLAINVTNICDALKVCQNVTLAAERLRCSRGYIYKVLKAAGLTPADVIKGKVTV